MTAILSLAAAAVQDGLQLLTIKPQRGFFPSASNTDSSIESIVAQATVEERHDDELEMTDQPVEQGAAITDHAYVRPSQLIIVCGWSNSPSGANIISTIAGFAGQSPALSALLGAMDLVDGVLNLLDGTQSAVQQAYDTLLTAYRGRTLFDVYTGKRAYENMLIKSLATTTNKEFENAMLIRIMFRQILMAQTQTVTVPDSSVMANPEQNGAVQNMGTKSLAPAPNINTSTLA